MFCSTWTPKFWDEETRTLRNSGLSFFLRQRLLSQTWDHRSPTPLNLPSDIPGLRTGSCWHWRLPLPAGASLCVPTAQSGSTDWASAPVRFSLEMLAPPLMKLLQHFYKCLLSLWSVQQRYKTIFQKPLILLFSSCISHFQCLFWTLYMNLVSVSVIITTNFSCLGFLNPLLHLKDYFKLETKIRNR